VAATCTLDARAGHEVPDRVDGEVDEVLLVVGHQDLRSLAGLRAKAERRLKPLELARPDPEVPAGRPERLELSGLDPVLHGAHRHLAPARDLTRRQIPHGDLKMAAIPLKSDNSSCSRRDFLTKLIFLADLGLECERGGTSGLVPLEF